MIASHPPIAPVLVVIGDLAIRAFVGWLFQGMGRTSTLTATWHQGIKATMDPPAWIIVDLHDVADKLAGVAVLRKTWGEDMPLIVLSHRPDIATQAAAMGHWSGFASR